MLLCLLDDARVPRMHPLLSRAPDPWLQRRDEIATPGTKTMLGFSDHVRSFVNPVWTTSLSGNDSDTTSRTGKQLDISHEKVRGISRSFLPAIHLEHYPCENFSFSPPSIDRRRTRQGSCPVCYVPVDQGLALMPAAHLSEDNLVLIGPIVVLCFVVIHPWNNEICLI
ncbi:unnamed protein product [Triticum turgidum subsp. durum]|uniref:Uncharacterized protein n=1 Tax=Triticum turgidum subsp. durum TaxID=4567 RepID=A0A9R1ALR4_TRITD|nr:unnamed protein product [Triticum turgidum subsp. durum]